MTGTLRTLWRTRNEWRSDFHIAVVEGLIGAQLPLSAYSRWPRRVSVRGAPYDTGLLVRAGYVLKAIGDPRVPAARRVHRFRRPMFVGESDACTFFVAERPVGSLGRSATRGGRPDVSPPTIEIAVTNERVRFTCLGSKRGVGFVPDPTDQHPGHPRFHAAIQGVCGVLCDLTRRVMTDDLVVWRHLPGSVFDERPVHFGRTSVIARADLLDPLELLGKRTGDFVDISVRSWSGLYDTHVVLERENGGGVIHKDLLTGRETHFPNPTFPPPL